MAIDIHPIALLAADVMLLAGFMWWITKPLRRGTGKLLKLVDDVAEIKKQVLPNGGTSVRDALDRLEQGQERIEGQNAEQTRRLDLHLQNHLTRR